MGAPKYVLIVYTRVFGTPLTRVFGQIFDQIFGQIFGQVFDQIFGQVFDQGGIQFCSSTGTEKYSFTVLPGQKIQFYKIQCTVLKGINKYFGPKYFLTAIFFNPLTPVYRASKKRTVLYGKKTSNFMILRFFR